MSELMCKKIPFTRVRKAVVCAAMVPAYMLLSGCLSTSTWTGQPSYVGRDDSNRSVYQAPVWEGGGYFVYENGGRRFLRDR